MEPHDKFAREVPARGRPSRLSWRAPLLMRFAARLADARLHTSAWRRHIDAVSREFWASPRVDPWRARMRGWLRDPLAGLVVLFGGMTFFTLSIILLERYMFQLPSPGLIYLPLIAMLAYYWGWRHAALGGLVEIICVYYFFTPPFAQIKRLTISSVDQLVTIAAVTGFVLMLVALARARRAAAEREAGRFAALHRVGASLSSELDESRLLHSIAQTARGLTGAGFAAFTLRPVDEFGEPLVPSEGNLFHLAAVVGVSKEQEALFRRMPLGGEGLLAPIFRHGVPVRVPDALASMDAPFHGAASEAPAAHHNAATRETRREAARRLATAYAHGEAAPESLRSLGVPHGHPIVRSFLGAPLLDRAGRVRGGLLLGHGEPNHFTDEDEALLLGLASQAALALENTRLFQAAQAQARELDAIFESIEDGISLVDPQGAPLRENRAARNLRELLARDAHRALEIAELIRGAIERARAGDRTTDTPVTIVAADGEIRDYVVSASPLQQPAPEPSRDGSPGSAPGSAPEGREDGALPASGAVVVWHDVTEARRLLDERRARAEAEDRQALLQAVIDELPSGVYLVRGRDARLVLANRAAADVWGAHWPRGHAMLDFLRASGTRIFAADGRELPADELATLGALRTGEAVHHFQEIIRRADGTALPILLNAVALDQGVLGPASQAGEAETDGAKTDGAAPAVLVVLQDVTALKEAERLKDEFIGIAAHELRNPMAAIKGFADMLMRQTRRGKGADLEAWQLEALTSIDEATTRLVELTEDLLDVTRLQAGRLDLHTAPGDVAALARRVAARLRVISACHRILVETEPEHVIADVDLRRTEQVLANLINNAIKYSPDGGDVTIAVRERPEAREAEITVSDPGIGIPTEQQALIFGRFARAENARELGIGGTGLGLYLCRELVERQGGRIWFESAEGRGSVFHVTLPLAQQISAMDDTDEVSGPEEAVGRRG